MFDKCIKCNRIGESCVPNLMLLPFKDLIQWCIKRQRYLEWTNQNLSDESHVPVGTINRVWAGEYQDCKYSTIKNILIALIGGTSDEFSCTEQVKNELKQLEETKQLTEWNTALEQENERLKSYILQVEEQHRSDMKELKAEHREQVAFLRDQLRTWQAAYQK